MLPVLTLLVIVIPSMTKVAVGFGGADTAEDIAKARRWIEEMFPDPEVPKKWLKERRPDLYDALLDPGLPARLAAQLSGEPGRQAGLVVVHSNAQPNVAMNSSARPGASIARANRTMPIAP